MAKNSQTIKWVLIGVLLAILLAGIALWYFILVDNIADTLTVEAGESFSADDFKLRDVEMGASFVTDMACLDLTAPGDYPVVIEYYGRNYDSILRVVDTVTPVVSTKSVTLFATQTPQAEAFVDTVEDHTGVKVAFAEEPDMTVEGEQIVQLQVTDQGGNTTLTTAKLNLIFDRQAPVITGVADMRVFIGFPVDVTAGVTVSDDLDPAPILTVDDSAVDQTKEGEYTLSYTAVDVCGNTTVETATMTVIRDTTGPQILGVNTMSLYQGSTMSYRSGVLLVDDYDDAPVLSIDSSQVNLNEPGTYDVTYTGTDAAGNVTTLTTTITIKERKSSYVEESVIYAKADELLSRFITEAMTTEEQVRAIYKWVRNNCFYSNISDKNDRLQAAWQMMNKGYGDCYNYYAICSLFMERLNIPHLAVRRSADSVRTTRHYWCLVSVDGGENYYHLDACPTLAFDTRICLVTDAVLENCNKYAPGYFTFDKELYPATPQEALE